MATTQNTFNGNGSNLGPFSFTFKWLESTDIKVSVGGVLKTAGTHYNLQGLNYTTKTGGQVLFTSGNAPPVGTNNIRIYRDTDDAELSATFSSGSAIRAKDLNDNFTQNLYVTQEVNNNSVNIDGSNPMVGDLDMGGKKILNLATPASSTDASTKGYVDSVVATGAANAAAAAASASAAASSATAAANTLDSFDDRYLGAKATDPTVDNDGNALLVGAIYFNSTSKVMRVWNGANWQDSSANANVLRWRKTAVGGETTLSGNDNSNQSLTYTVNLEAVFLNGALLQRGVDYVATTGNSITGLVALTAGDVVEVLAFSQVSLLAIPSSTVTFTQSGTDVQRTVETKLKDVVSVKDFGAVGNGFVNDTAAIQAALNYAIGANKPLRFGPGTFLISNQITYTVTAADRQIHIMLDGATLKSGALTVANIDIDGSSYRPTFRLVGPGYVDGSALILNPGVASGSFLVIDNCDRVEVADIYFSAGTYGDGKGDSAIVPGQCGSVIISNCHFKGWDDHGIYFTGGATGGAQYGRDSVVSGCVFEDLSGAIRWARSTENLLVSGNVFKSCYNCVVAAGGNTNWNPGNTVVITGNLVDGCLSSAFDLRYFEEGVTISGNSVYDWGAGVAGGSGAINLRGIQRSVVTGNLFSTKNPSNTPATDTYNAVGIYLTSATNPDLGAGDTPSNTYMWEAQNNLIANNVFHILQVNTASGGRNAAIVDMKGDGSNHYVGNKIINGGTSIRYWVNNAGTNGYFGNPWFTHHTATGLGVGTDAPGAPLEVVTKSRVSRKEAATTQYLDSNAVSGANQLWSHSSPSSANKLFLNATTDASHTTPTGGAIGLNLRVLNVDKISCNVDDVIMGAPLRLKSYTTGTLPTTNISAGTIAYDNTTGTVKFYNGSVWANI